MKLRVNFCFLFFFLILNLRDVQPVDNLGLDVSPQLRDEVAKNKEVTPSKSFYQDPLPLDDVIDAKKIKAEIAQQGVAHAQELNDSFSKLEDTQEQGVYNKAGNVARAVSDIERTLESLQDPLEDPLSPAQVQVNQKDEAIVVPAVQAKNDSEKVDKKSFVRKIFVKRREKKDDTLKVAAASRGRQESSVHKIDFEKAIIPLQQDIKKSTQRINQFDSKLDKVAKSIDFKLSQTQARIEKMLEKHTSKVEKKVKGIHKRIDKVASQYAGLSKMKRSLVKERVRREFADEVIKRHLID